MSSLSATSSAAEACPVLPDGSRYLGDVPPVWVAMHEVALRHVDQELSFERQTAAARALLEFTLGTEDQPGIDNEMMDDTRNFAEGLLACLVGQVLADPKAVDRIVEGAADDLVEIQTRVCNAFDFDRERGLYVAGSLQDPDLIECETLDVLLANQIRPTLLELYDASPLTQRLVANALLITRYVRFTQLSVAGEAEQSAELPELPRDELTDFLLNSTVALNGVMLNVFKGGLSLLKLALRLRAEVPNWRQAFGVPLTELGSLDSLAIAVPQTTALQGARMRMDQARGGAAARYGKLDERGALDLSAVPPAGPLPAPNPSLGRHNCLHEATLACPALPVRTRNTQTGVMEALVPKIVPIVVRTLTRAQNKLGITA